MPHHLIKTATGIAAMLVLASCAPTQQQVSDQSHDLLAAGFASRPADTPARLAMLQKLPADTFIHQGEGDSAAWIFADPAGCHCVYLGSSQAYERYKLHRLDVASHGTSNTVQVTDPTHEFSAYGPWGSRYDFATTFGF